MKDILTTEQSQLLIELGVDPSKASGEKVFIDIHPEVLKGNAEYARPWGFIPTFRLTGILSLLPKEIHDIEINVTFYLAIETDCNGTWLATYREYRGGEIAMEIGEKVAPELIDALCELLVWCITNKHLKL